MLRPALVAAALVATGGLASAQPVPALKIPPAALVLAVPDQPVANRVARGQRERDAVPSVRAGASSQPASPAPFTAVDRWVATAAGAFLGFWTGARIGYVATATGHDDVSGLRGVVVGAPVGAVVGAIVGYRLTR